MTIIVMRMTQRKVEDPVPDMMTRERSRVITINKMSSLGSARDPVTESVSGVVTITMSI